MKYQSTRGTGDLKDFDDVLVAAYAGDGGLYVPVELPKLSMEQLETWRSFSFPQVCAEIMHLFTDINIQDLNEMTSKAFSGFNGGLDPLPLTKYEELYLLDTSLGPTMAFKDIGQQMVGQLLNYVLGKKGKKATIIVETSGDTGPAAIAGVRGCKNVNIFCLYPYQRVSDVQELQMITVDEENVFVYRTEGNSDLQASVLKEIFSDKEFVEKYNVCSVNSINWARIAAQSSYYVWAFVELYFNRGLSNGDTSPHLNFVIPTGAFGNAMGGYIAKLMGVPIGKIICATNKNDIVHRTISSGDLRMAENYQTESPAMDIQFAYNLERMLFYVTGQDTVVVSTIMDQLEKQYSYSDGANGVTLDAAIVEKVQAVFASIAVSDLDTLVTIKNFHSAHNIVLCPHSAVGVYAALGPFKGLTQTVTTICVLTAHPAKFESAVVKALGHMPVTSSKVDEMRTSAQKFEWLRIPQVDQAIWRGEWIRRIKSDVEKIVHEIN